MRIRNAPRAESSRREEILQHAAILIASSGPQTSLQQIADATDLQLGSLYHHFRSKDEILVELLRRYHADLDRIGEVTQQALDAPQYRPAPERLTELGATIAACAIRHRAALQLTFYEAPSGNPELKELVRRRPVAINRAMLDTLRALRWTGVLRRNLDLPVTADRTAQTMLHVGLDAIRHQAPAERTVEVLAGILLNGLATTETSDDRLDASNAFTAADNVVRTWIEQPGPAHADTAGRVRAAARTEFARRGFETTTLRDIAAAAEVGVGTVHRVIGSKDEVLATIMRSFGEHVIEGWASVFRSDSSPVEKLDAMMWININTLHHYPDEFKIQLAWLRQASPNTAEPGWHFTQQLEHLAAVVSEGIDDGEIRPDIAPVDQLAQCVISVQWIPENILLDRGTRAALQLGRDTVLRGIAR
ncbi:transcriptional regulator, TetR family [Cryptosporangium aurantiacum]|uniref:Transcriptional regulator, TetR family n=1 Tax=Cryptosporangium aurantiacum TaxID=134849 RepID=A0A1M7Q279_9ACTN|nr:transcriptional regulator, TetR family [Cryptosporangium aurantiacum]